METNFFQDDHWKSEIARFLKGELSYSEEQLLKQWLSENDEHDRFFEDMRNTWLSSVTLATESSQLDKKWAQMNSRLNFKKSDTNQNKPIVKVSTIRRFASIAAALILAMVIGAVFSRILFPH